MSHVSRPILVIDDDQDDNLLLELAIKQLHPERPVRFFEKGDAVLTYLQTTQEQPFLILSEVRLPGMSGLELRQAMNNDVLLRNRSIPFVFMFFPVMPHSVEQAYTMTVQGYFEKPQRANELQAVIGSILDYWPHCVHPA